MYSSIILHVPHASADYNALMVGVNKKVYMDERTLEKNSRFSKVKADIQGLYGLLMETIGRPSI